MKLTDLQQRAASHVIVFGDPKVGKTTLAASLLKAGYKLIYISNDNGHTVLFKVEFTPFASNVDIILLPDTREFPVAIATCLKLFTGAKVSICHAHGQVDCSICRKNAAAFSEYQFNALGLDTVVVLDHISQVADSAMNLICNNIKKPPELVREVAEGTYKPTWEDFRVQGTLMSKLLMNIQQAPYHVLCLAHVTETEMEAGAKKLVPQIGTVPFSRNSPKYFDHVVYMEMMNKSHRAGSMTTYSAQAIAGSRTDVAIELQKDGFSLAPFFNGTIKPATATLNAADKQRADGILGTVKV